MSAGQRPSVYSNFQQVSDQKNNMFTLSVKPASVFMSHSAERLSGDVQTQNKMVEKYYSTCDQEKMSITLWKAVTGHISEENEKQNQVSRLVSLTARSSFFKK